MHISHIWIAERPLRRLLLWWRTTHYGVFVLVHRRGRRAREAGGGYRAAGRGPVVGVVVVARRSAKRRSAKLRVASCGSCVARCALRGCGYCGYLLRLPGAGAGAGPRSSARARARRLPPRRYPQEGAGDDSRFFNPLCCPPQ
jgi:hypothetical protein